MTDAEKLGHVVLVGAGNMGGAMLRRWPPGANVTIIDPVPREAILAHAERSGYAHRAEATGVGEASILLIAVKPQLMGEVLPKLAPLVGTSTVAVSIAAGTTVEALASALGTAKIVRTIPNTPARVGRGMTGAYAGNAVTGTDRARVEALLECSGEVVWVESEADIDKVTAVSGSGPAYVFHMVEALATAARELGLEAEAAERIARQTVVGAGALLEAADEDAATLRRNVTSQGGTTAAALDVLMAPDGLSSLMERAVHAAHERAKALGRGE